ncbi:OadG family protein [Aliiglaciecola sp. M165]|uniref:OadG family protein n=1 Tax=Aliiglaciecola sp. M165 TaxID=2593649 RepID=UPI0021B0EA65|nr:OadG family transporter subunit [Aliiglaciecola sp. M165]
MSELWLSFQILNVTYLHQIVKMKLSMQAPISELLTEAATLMVVGMIVVFVFLTLLIGAVNLIAFINSKFPEEVTPSVSGVNRAKQTASGGSESTPIAAISAAIHKYRSKR